MLDMYSAVAVLLDTAPAIATLVQKHDLVAEPKKVPDWHLRDLFLKSLSRWRMRSR